MRPISRNHHYVPQCYLKNFATNRRKPKITVIDLARRQKFSSHPKNIAVERDFNSIDLPGMRSDSFENDFSSFEQKVSEALERILKDKAINTNSDKVTILDFISVLAVKNPRGRRMMNEFQNELLDKILRMSVRDEGSYWGILEKIIGGSSLKKKNYPTYQSFLAGINNGSFELKMTSTDSVRLELDTYMATAPTSTHEIGGFSSQNRRLEISLHQIIR